MSFAVSIALLAALTLAPVAAAKTHAASGGAGVTVTAAQRSLLSHSGKRSAGSGAAAAQSARSQASVHGAVTVITDRQAAKLAGHGVAAAPQSSEGTDFWLAFESNCATNGCGSPSGPGNLFIFISGNTATSGTLTVPGISFSTPFTVTPGSVTSIQLPSTAEDDLSDTVANLGVHITSGAAVSAYGLNTLQYTTDGFLGLPTNILGSAYLVEGYGDGTGSQFAVLATQDGTTVTITPSEDVGPYTAGTPYQVTLNQGEVYQLVDSGGGDLSGTSITSNNPVAVFAGNDCADVPLGYGACNTLAEEMTPTNSWGTDFVTEPLASRTGDTFRFMASQNGTTVNVNGSPVATLNAGQFYETILTTASQITSNNPIEVMQYSNGQGYDGANADPFDITIPPDAQFLNSYTVTTEPSGADPAITTNYINVTAPTSEVGSVTLDGTAIPAADFSPIAGSSFSGAQVSVAFGSHVLNGPLPFGVTVYGFGGYDGYGYPGGFTLSPIATVSSITLSGGGTGPVGTQTCASATVKDQFGNALDNIQVTFTVTGVNPQTGFAYTGASGQPAMFCYTGANAGTDNIVASVQSVQSNQVTFVWTQAPPTGCTVDSTAGSALAADGESIRVENALSSNLSAAQHLVLNSLVGGSDFFRLATVTTAICRDNTAHPLGAGDQYNLLAITGTGSFGSSSTTASPGYTVKAEFGVFGASPAGDFVTFTITNTSTGAVVWKGNGYLTSGSEVETG